MVVKRSKLEIYLDILRVMSLGINKPTKIMYGSNLSWKPLMKALDSLSKQGLIIRYEFENHSKYDLTEKGREVLNYLKEATSLLKIQ